MTALREQEMLSIDEFLAWAERQPGRWELVDGVPTAMSPERVIHGDTKYRLPCAPRRRHRENQGAVPVRARQRRGPHRSAHALSARRTGLVCCGGFVAADALEIPNPILVCEVLSPGNAMTDLRDKLQGYFRIASVTHYLIVDPDKRIVIHHARGMGDVVATRIVSEGTLRLDPPGIDIEVRELFG